MSGICVSVLSIGGRIIVANNVWHLETMFFVYVSLHVGVMKNVSGLTFRQYIQMQCWLIGSIFNGSVGTSEA